jgi:hypothetical protein
VAGAPCQNQSSGVRPASSEHRVIRERQPQSTLQDSGECKRPEQKCDGLLGPGAWFQVATWLVSQGQHSMSMEQGVCWAGQLSSSFLFAFISCFHGNTSPADMTPASLQRSALGGGLADRSEWDKAQQMQATIAPKGHHS